MSHSRSIHLPRLGGLLLASAAGLLACGEERSAGAADPRPQAEEARDPRLAEARLALEDGFPDAAWTLLDQIGGGDIETGLLRARAALLEGDAVGALREVEAVRSDGAGAELYATEVEILAALDRLVSAREILREAYARVGRVPALERARGVVLLRTPGGAVEALAALEGAYAGRPRPGFIGFPLAQARLLVGRQKLSEDPQAALHLARLARSFDATHPDYRELEAEALSAAMLFGQALEIYASLEADGHSFGDTPALLHQKFATSLLLDGDREGATGQYLRARELGLDDEGLGFGSEVLEEAATRRIDEGIALFGEKRFDPAAEAFAEALALSPENLEARNHLGVVRFQLEDYAGAARAWKKLLQKARKAAVALPDPVHLNLARAWRLAGRVEKAREVLSDYLDREPDGRWSEATRDLLARVELEELAR